MLVSDNILSAGVVYMHIVIMRETCLPPSSLNWPLHRFPSNLYKVKKVISMKFHLTINKAKKNQPSN